MTIECIECKSDIDESAKICRYCQSYQKNWKNRFRFAALTAGLFAVIGSASAYILGEAAYWERQLNWQDKVDVIEFVRSGKSTFLNSGDGEIYLSHVKLIAPESGWEEVTPINAVVQPENFFVISNTPLERIKKHRYRVGANISNETFRRYLHATALWDECVFFDAYYEQGGIFENLLRTYGQALNTFSVEGTLRYRSSFQGSWQSHPLDLKGVLILSSHKDCDEHLSELRSIN